MEKDKLINLWMAHGYLGETEMELVGKEIPSEVGKLLHLRYLDLSQNAALKALPEQLPNGMGKLTKLRHRQMIGSSLSFMPKGLERLASLRTVSYFIVCSSEKVMEAANLGDLNQLNKLEGNLLTRNLENVVDVGEALNAELKNKKKLLGLFLDFTWEEIGLQMNDDNLIEALQAPSDL
ncbi:hypothetical protein RCOM_1291040 [Ricinus communis]|uniref:Disease resistance R13L4/SHOC-2-like LRR domain-containing protein n=1 Tax=Ricinus communis TaxID=3988 RepID=B9SDS8_RICCO|nr:hypothetical protein RCOM_1291040 [Ricinus communis]